MLKKDNSLKFDGAKPIYQIFVRSFFDSNNDGIGDINGITSKLTYLASLGVSVLNLSPIFETRNKDFGLDVVNYRNINKEYGTIEDLKRLVNESAKHNIKVVLDLPLDETSNEYFCFLASKNISSPYHDFYCWKKGRLNNAFPPNNWKNSFKESVWTFDKEVGAYYLHLNNSLNPTLNYSSLEVRREMNDILNFYLDIGVAGFRLLGVNNLFLLDQYDFKKKRNSLSSLENILNVLKASFGETIEKRKPLILISIDDISLLENVDLSSLGSNFIFEANVCSFSKRGETTKKPFSTKILKKRIIALNKIHFGVALSLENYSGLRSLSLFKSNEKTYPYLERMLPILVCSLFTYPSIYQGEEIGLMNYKYLPYENWRDPLSFYLFRKLRKLSFSETRALKKVSANSRDNVRATLPWNKNLNFGFSKAKTPWIMLNPLYEKIDIASQNADPNSLLNFYKSVIAFRKSNEDIVLGSFEVLDTQNDVLAFFRAYNGKLYFVLINLSNRTLLLEKNIREMRGEVLLSNYLGAGLTYKRKLRPYEALIALLS